MALTGPVRAASIDEAADRLIEASRVETVLRHRAEVRQLLAYGPDLSSSVVRADGVPGGEALRIDIRRPGTQPWASAVETKLSADPIPAGQTLRFAFWARAADGARRAAIPAANLQLAREPYTPIARTTAMLTSQWQLFTATGRTREALRAEDVMVSLHLGGERQSIEIGPILVFALGEPPVAGAAPAVMRAGPPGRSGPKAEKPAVIPPGLERAIDDIRSALPVPGDVLLARDEDPWTITGESFEAAPVTAEGVPGGRATRITVTRPGSKVWDVTASTKIPGTIARGDTVLMAFWARTVASSNESQSGVLPDVQVQEAKAPFRSVARGHADVPKTWKRFYVVGTAGQDWNAGETNATVHLAAIRQTIDLGPLVVFNLGADIDPAALRQTKLDYPGRAKGAPWRRAALARIEDIRKGNLEVTVTDRAGNPVSGVPLTIEMERHAFRFGAFIGHDFGDDTKDSTQRLRETFGEFFNFATAPMYWQDWGWLDADKRASYLDAMAWLHVHRIPWRGHPVIYPAKIHSPERLVKLADQPRKLRREVMAHVRSAMGEASRYGPVSFDMLNEPRTGTWLTDITGDRLLDEAFAAAREIAPQADLFVNEFGIINAGGFNQSNIIMYHSWIQDALARGLPLGGIGIQGHFGAGLTNPARVLEIFDEFARYGLPLQITEFDIDTVDEIAQADFTRDMLIAAFSHPAVTGFSTWGWWAGDHWKPNAAMLREDWSVKPNGQVWKQLVRRDWWTREVTTTNADGKALIRGFLGNYLVTATVNGETVRLRTSLERTGTRATLVVD